MGLYQTYQIQPRLTKVHASLADMEDALLYLSKTGAMKLEGGFLVLCNGMELTRLVLDNKIRYKLDDCKTLNEYYRQKIQQIHIVGEYANLMVRDYGAALQFVQDYFQTEIQAVRQEDGVVQIIRHSGGNLEQVIQTYRGGTACVLTTTNEEALRVLGLLTKRGVCAKLIQSADGFRLYDLAEVRFFLKKLGHQTGASPNYQRQRLESGKTAALGKIPGERLS